MRPLGEERCCALRFHPHSGTLRATRDRLLSPSVPECGAERQDASLLPRQRRLRRRPRCPRYWQTTCMALARELLSVPPLLHIQNLQLRQRLLPHRLQHTFRQMHASLFEFQLHSLKGSIVETNKNASVCPTAAPWRKHSRPFRILPGGITIHRQPPGRPRNIRRTFQHHRIMTG